MFESVSNFFGSIGSSVKSGWNSIFGGSSATPAATVPYTPAKVATPVAVSKVTSNPKSVAVNSSTPAAGAQQTSFLDFVNNAIGTVKSGVETFFKVKNSVSDAKTATKLNEIRNDAVVQLAQNANPVAQTALPGYGDWISNPSGAQTALLPSIFSGSNIGGGISGIAYLLGGAALVYVLVKK